MRFWMGFVDATHRELIERTWNDDDDDEDDEDDDDDDDDDDDGDDDGAGGIKASANLGQTWIWSEHCNT